MKTEMEDLVSLTKDVTLVRKRLSCWQPWGQKQLLVRCLSVHMQIRHALQSHLLSCGRSSFWHLVVWPHAIWENCSSQDFFDFYGFFSFFSFRSKVTCMLQMGIQTGNLSLWRCCTQAVTLLFSKSFLERAIHAWCIPFINIFLNVFALVFLLYRYNIYALFLSWFYLPVSKGEEHEKMCLEYACNKLL